MDEKKQKRLKNQRKLKKLGISLFKDLGGIPAILIIFTFSSLFSGLLLYWIIHTNIELTKIIEILNPFGLFIFYVYISFMGIFIFWVMLIISELTINWIKLNYKDELIKEIKNKR